MKNYDNFNENIFSDNDLKISDYMNNQKLEKIEKVEIAKKDPDTTASSNSVSAYMNQYSKLQNDFNYLQNIINKFIDEMCQIIRLNNDPSESVDSMLNKIKSGYADLCKENSSLKAKYQKILDVNNKLLENIGEEEIQRMSSFQSTANNENVFENNYEMGNHIKHPDLNQVDRIPNQYEIYKTLEQRVNMLERELQIRKDFHTVNVKNDTVIKERCKSGIREIPRIPGEMSNITNNGGEKKKIIKKKKKKINNLGINSNNGKSSYCGDCSTNSYAKKGRSSTPLNPARKINIKKHIK